MKKITAFVLIIVILISYIHVYAEVTGPVKIHIENYLNNTNDKTYQLAALVLEANDGSTSTITYKIRGWNIRYSGTSFLYEVPADESPETKDEYDNKLVSFAMPFTEDSGHQNTSIEAQIKSKLGINSTQYKAWMTLMKNGGITYWDAYIEKYVNKQPTSIYAKTLSEALALANWSQETKDYLTTQYYNQCLDIPAQPLVSVNADFSIYHEGTNVTDNTSNPIKRTSNTLQLTLEDNSTVENDTITKREWKYWDVAKGLTLLPNQGVNDTTLAVDTSALNVNPNKIAFYLKVISSTGGTADKYHTVYSELAAPPPIVGPTGTINIHYQDSAGADLAPSEAITAALDTPTEIYSIPISGYVPTKMKDTVTVPSTDADKIIDYIFAYTKAAPVSQVFAIIDAPYNTTMGNDCYFTGEGSYTTDTTDSITQYQWTFNKPFVIVSGFTQGSGGVVYGKEGVIYFTEPGECTAELVVRTQNGSTDSDTHKTTISPPYPNTILTAQDIRVNHKITADASTSTSKSDVFPIDWTKTEWEISIEDASKGLTIDDIKTLHTYTLTTNAAGQAVMKITGDITKIELLSKKEGKINIRCTLYTTVGYSSYAMRTVNISPDLAPEAIYSYTNTSLRDPNDNNYASFDLIDLSKQNDGDPIGKRVWIYCFDSDNDGDYREETWYVLDNDTWQPVTNYGIDGSFASLEYLNIDLINDGNKPSIVLKINHVGKCEVHLIIREELNSTNSIPEFITSDDIKMESTLPYIYN